MSGNPSLRSYNNLKGVERLKISKDDKKTNDKKIDKFA